MNKIILWANMANYAFCDIFVIVNEFIKEYIFCSKYHGCEREFERYSRIMYMGNHNAGFLALLFLPIIFIAKKIMSVLLTNEIQMICLVIIIAVILFFGLWKIDIQKYYETLEHESSQKHRLWRITLLTFLAVEWTLMKMVRF